MTSMRHRYVASTPLRRHVPAGNLAPLPPRPPPQYSKPCPPPPNILNLLMPMWSSNLAHLSSKTCIKSHQNHAKLTTPAELSSKPCGFTIKTLQNCHQHLAELSSKLCRIVIKTLQNCHQNSADLLSKPCRIVIKGM